MGAQGRASLVRNNGLSLLSCPLCGITVPRSSSPPPIFPPTHPTLPLCLSASLSRAWLSRVPPSAFTHSTHSPTYSPIDNVYSSLPYSAPLVIFFLPHLPPRGRQVSRAGEGQVAGQRVLCGSPLPHRP
ncbi:hypothetical protein E2C01_092575 [Portunus trituberculatus]|uniref:Uncharacterized protein n=1 Tax=Portunus trituberculatus TaxID=210409 RepID=A0A5B7JKL6_PORTR|nr:hypothetical protein [Portunus trituberculatus]